MFISKYQYIVTIAELKSISKAAKELYISQPALTKFINKIEDDAGIKLFNRDTIPISLTYAGEVYVQEARKMLDIQRKLDKEIEDLNAMKKGRITIGASSSRGEIFFPAIFPIFHKLYPGIEINVIEEDYSGLEKRLQKGELDLIITATPNIDSSLTKELISEELVYLVVSENNPIIADCSIEDNSPYNMIYIDPQKLDGEDFVCMFPGHALANTTEEISKKYGFRPKTIIETHSSVTAYKLAVKGMGMTFATNYNISNFFPEYLPVLCKIDEESYKRENYIVYKQGDYLSKTTQAFIKLAKEIAEEKTTREISHEEYINARKKAKV